MKKTTHPDPSKPPAMSIAEAYDQADRESVKRQIANLDRLIAKRENEKGLPAEDNGHSTENLRGAPPVDLPDLDPARLNEEARGVWLWERGELVLDVVDGRLETLTQRVGSYRTPSRPSPSCRRPASCETCPPESSGRRTRLWWRKTAEHARFASVFGTV